MELGSLLPDCDKVTPAVIRAADGLSTGKLFAMRAVKNLIAEYVGATTRLQAQPGTNEASYYPDLRDLLAGVLASLRLPFAVRTGTSEMRSCGVDMPDFVLGDAEFVGVFGEVKLPSVSLEQMAVSVERNDQIGRYLAATGVVLLSNVRGLGLLTVRSGVTRISGVPVLPVDRELIQKVDLWSAVVATPARVEDSAATKLVEVLDRAVTQYARLAEPSDLAKVLARQARDAKDALPADLRPIPPASQTPST